MSDRYALAAGHLRAAMTLMAECRDTLAVATIAQAVVAVERGGGEAAAAVRGTDLPVGNRRPC